jgi:Right handed beta helix region
MAGNRAWSTKVRRGSTRSGLLTAALATAVTVGGFVFPVSVCGASERTVACPAQHPVVNISGSSPQQRQILADALKVDGTTVRLGPDVDLDFTDFPLPLSFGRCVTLTSIRSFIPPPPEAAGTISRGNASRVPAPGHRRGPVSGFSGEPAVIISLQARTPRSLGPVLRYGNHRQGAFLEIGCPADGANGDGARISGFRLYGPDFGNQTTDEFGIHIGRCVDIEISNMEIAGWGGAGIQVNDDESEINGTGGRILFPDQVKIHDNFIHHNQHPSDAGHAMGYGVEANHGAWARVFQNVFDFNRHAISAAQDSGGYAAERNLVLKGGGYHGKFYERYTHIFDIHGSGCWCSSDVCGDHAGAQFWFEANAFQYRKDHAIRIRGRPGIQALISGNIFPYPGLVGGATACIAFGDDAINLDKQENVDIGPGNVINFDSFGNYGVCDFDGDGIDDLFLATGASWWFASSGKFHWTYLNDKKERLDQVRLGYFDNDLRCDVLAEQNGQWVISSGGSGNWQPLGAFGVPLSEVQFGRFDPNDRDHRPNVTRRTTHAFRRAPDGQWFVTPLLGGPAWKPVESSSFPMNQLRFGDFTGDGVTDVLAVVGGRWAISESAAGPWRTLNPNLGDAVGDLFIANMDADDNIDDILRLERKSQLIMFDATCAGTLQRQHITLTWWRSKNGTQPWQRWKEYVYDFCGSDPEEVFPQVGFAGRFGAAPGGGTLVVDPYRLGHFYSEAQLRAGATSEWTSLFPY